ncbi:5-(carboxyamino)imidazole ribonucleotide synthase [Leucothrix pacifica]|uniref:N5-carboxyaminoimidazole ribonucleotide synthase n=2 Tax=Leucothrix pacifica TaxID=1247513 RepID=A0A317CLR4_9GAMM|nr:5-(carboxyamino)imidazole ribonucleotide synthase [Leucothrix pacifica]
MILPGATIGMIGGGQLGRMFVIAAKYLGYNVLVLEPGENSPAGQVADEQIVAAYDAPEALATFAQRCDVITTEFENIPASVLETLSESTPVRPSAAALSKTQDRIVEKDFIRSCGLLPVPYGAIRTRSEVALAIDAIKFPAILKTARFGYDGKGQITVNTPDEVVEAYESHRSVDCVLEQRVDLDCEISVVLSRNENGDTQCFPVSENVHVDGILFQSIVPARVDPDIARAAQVAAKRIATKLDYVGVLAVEFFVTKKAELLVNEIAPRTHNSGHFTIDACVTSQFEQQVRTVCNLPFGDTRLLTPVVMTNLLGDIWGDTQPDWSKVFNSAASKLHLYGKAEARDGRKMGHFCTLADNVDDAITEATKIFEQLSES